MDSGHASLQSEMTADLNLDSQNTGRMGLTALAAHEETKISEQHCRVWIGGVRKPELYKSTFDRGELWVNPEFFHLLELGIDRR